MVLVALHDACYTRVASDHERCLWHVFSFAGLWITLVILVARVDCCVGLGLDELVRKLL